MLAGLPDDRSRYVTEVYKRMNEIEEAYNTWHALAKQGKGAAAQAYFESNREKITRHNAAQMAKKVLSTIDQRIRMIERDASLDAATKADQIKELSARRNQFAYSVTQQVKN